MAANKIVVNDETIIDLTGDSVTPETLLQGATAHDASGAAITGTMVRSTGLKVIISVTSGAEVTATKGSLSVSGTSVNGTCTLVVPKGGEWFIEATLNGDSAFKDVFVSDHTAASLYFISDVLNDNDWAAIRQMSDDGEGENYWSIGDRKAIVLNGTVGALTLSNYTCYAFIIGFNHNQYVEGAERIHFQLAKTDQYGGADVALCDSGYYTTAASAGFRMNPSNTNAGGWFASYMRTEICGTNPADTPGTILAAIPAELLAVLKPTTKFTDNIGNKTTGATAVTATTDYFFLLAEFEVFGSISSANQNEKSKQAQYAYYSAGNSKVKYNHSSPSAAVAWGLRSPAASYSGNFVGVYTGGTVSYPSANRSLGFAPAFCV